MTSVTETSSSCQDGTYRTGSFQLKAMTDMLSRFRTMKSTPITPPTRTIFALPFRAP